MARFLRPALLAALVVLGIGLIGSAVRRGATAAQPQTLYSQKVVFGRGAARSFVTRDDRRRPIALGVEFTADGLSGLPECMRETVVPLPANTAVPPYNHVTIDWNPHGHIPARVYDVPHFDFHFYLMSQEQRAGITAKGDDLARTVKAPPAGYLPQGYITAPDAAEPAMGNHWVDQAAPEFHGTPFTYTFVYGSYDGMVNFLEPMVTLAFLQAKPNVTAPVPQPQRYQKAGYYPTQYTIRYVPEQNVYRVSLDNLVRRKAAR